MSKVDNIDWLTIIRNMKLDIDPFEYTTLLSGLEQAESQGLICRPASREELICTLKNIIREAKGFPKVDDIADALLGKVAKPAPKVLSVEEISLLIQKTEDDDYEGQALKIHKAIYGEGVNNGNS